MKTKKIKGEKWVSFENTKTYENFTKKREDKKSGMELELHNHSDLKYDRAKKSIKFFMKSLLGKFKRKSNWKVEVWIDENPANNNTKFSCGVALARPKQTTIYAKRIANNLNAAVKESLSVIQTVINKEQAKKHKLNIYKNIA